MEKNQSIDSYFSINLFWDADTKELNMEKHASYIIGRVLDYGRWEDWLFICNYYGLDKIKEISMDIKNLFPESLSFISTITHTPENQFKCYKQIHSKNPHWIF